MSEQLGHLWSPDRLFRAVESNEHDSRWIVPSRFSFLQQTKAAEKDNSEDSKMTGILGWIILYVYYPPFLLIEDKLQLNMR